MLLTSPSFENGASIPRKFTCDGGDFNPELQIQNVPPEAKSLALIMHDPDAPRGGGFTHWIVWNIDPATTLIKEESVPPKSVEGKNTAGQNSYMGPCPGSDEHHYIFKLFALDEMLSLPLETTVQDLEREIEKHIVEATELTGLYARG